MKASLSKAVCLFAAPLSQTARVVDALRAKAEAGAVRPRRGAGAADAEVARTEAAADAAPSRPTDVAEAWRRDR